MLMICFALLWDAETALGRTGLGLSVLISVNRYILPNIVLLTGIVMYAWAHRPPFSLSLAGSSRWPNLTSLAMLLLAGLVVVQVFVSTSYGLSNGREVHNAFVESARLWVNLDRVPAQYRSCEVDVVLNERLFSGLPPPEIAADRLGEFGPTSYRYFRMLGPPPLSPICTQPDLHHLAVEL
jgi:hypothetical protein